MEAIKVQTQLASRYRILDATGKLPFDVVLGLRRRSSADKDSRDISFRVAGSILDVPCALVHGLLSLHELRASESGARERVEVDLSSLRDAIADDEPTPEHIVLPSKVNRIAKKDSETFTVYHYRINPDSPLASLLKPDRKYRIALAKRDLGVHDYILVDGDKPNSEVTKDSPSTCNLVSNPHGGFAVFRVKGSLVWPQVETRMRLLSASSAEHVSSIEESWPLLQATFTNTGSDPISVQTRGHQRFLQPWGVLQPEEDGLSVGKGPRIIDPTPSTSGLQVVDTATGSVVRGHPKQRGSCSGVTSGSADLRPRVEDLLIMEPEVPIVREIGTEVLLRGLQDGKYCIRMRPRGCWWYSGSLESDPDDGGRVPKRLLNSFLTPLVLETEDEVEIHIESGKPVVKG